MCEGMMRKTEVKLKAANGRPINLLGEATVKFMFNKEVVETVALISDEVQGIVLSFKVSCQLKIVSYCPEIMEAMSKGTIATHDPRTATISSLSVQIPRKPKHATGDIHIEEFICGSPKWHATSQTTAKSPLQRRYIRSRMPTPPLALEGDEEIDEKEKRGEIANRRKRYDCNQTRRFYELKTRGRRGVKYDMKKWNHEGLRDQKKMVRPFDQENPEMKTSREYQYPRGLKGPTESQTRCSSGRKVKKPAHHGY